MCFGGVLLLSFGIEIGSSLCSQGWAGTLTPRKKACTIPCCVSRALKTDTFFALRAILYRLPYVRK